MAVAEALVFHKHISFRISDSFKYRGIRWGTSGQMFAYMKAFSSSVIEKILCAVPVKKKEGKDDYWDFLMLSFKSNL